jgi:hypothetical protein
MVTIAKSQVVSDKGGKVRYIDNEGNLCVVEASQAEIVGEVPATPAQEDEQLSQEVATTAPAPEVTPEKSAKPKRASKKKAAPATTEGDKTMAKSKKKAPKKEAAGSMVRTINGKEVSLAGYQKAKAPGGGTSYNNGDEVAQKLAGKDLDGVYSVAAKTLKTEEKDLRARFKHLNPGMQRMNLGNMMRKILIPKKAA